MSRNYCEYKVVENEAQASYRFDQFSSKDPLPDIPPALLNSGDIHDYARITSMVFPFKEDKLKPASYEIDFLGEVYQRNEETGEKEIITITKGVLYTLKKNSIVFISIQTKFFLPDYIAIRFNLKITHVHRGLLLGTGPLVDPGFKGRLLIPLHNLTSEDYYLDGGKGLIWVEFTKLSPHKKWSTYARDGSNYVKFPPMKGDLQPHDYFCKASPNCLPASSSIPGEIKIAKETANYSRDKVDEFEKEINKRTNFAVIGFSVSIAALILTSWDVISTANQNVVSARSEIISMKYNLYISEEKVRILEEKIESFSKRWKDRKNNAAAKD